MTPDVAEATACTQDITSWALLSSNRQGMQLAASVSGALDLHVVKLATLVCQLSPRRTILGCVHCKGRHNHSMNAARSCACHACRGCGTRAIPDKAHASPAGCRAIRPAPCPAIPDGVPSSTRSGAMAARPLFAPLRSGHGGSITRTAAPRWGKADKSTDPQTRNAGRAR